MALPDLKETLGDQVSLLKELRWQQNINIGNKIRKVSVSERKQ